MTVEQVGNVAIVTFTIKKLLDKMVIQIISDQLFALINEDECEKIVIDFRHVEYLSSDSYGRIITFDKMIRMTAKDYRLCNICSETYEVICITRLNRLLKFGDIDPDMLRSTQGLYQIGDKERAKKGRQLALRQLRAS